MRKLFSLIAAILFAGSMFAAVQEFTMTIAPTDFPGGSYAANNGEHTSIATATADPDVKVSVKWTSNQVMNQSSKIQGQKNKAALYNTASWGTIKSITINDNENYSYVIGATAQPTASATGGFFKIVDTGATAKASSIVIVFDADPDVASLDVDKTIAYGTVMLDDETPVALPKELVVKGLSLAADVTLSTSNAKVSLSKTLIDKGTGEVNETVIVTLTSGLGVVNEKIYIASGDLKDTVAVTANICKKIFNEGTPIVHETTPTLYTLEGKAADTVFVNNEDAFKMGTSSDPGSITFNLPANTKKFRFFAAAWSGKACNVHVSCEEAEITSPALNASDSLMALTADGGIAGATTNYETVEGDWTNFQYEITLEDDAPAASLVFASNGSNKRFVLWGVTYELAAPAEYNIFISGSIAYGNIVADKTSAAEGETVTLTITPEDNYELDELTVTGLSASDITINGNTATFIMPGHEVDVNATFVPVPQPVSYCQLPQGHLGDANFADPSGRILLTIQKVQGTNNIRVAIKNNNANGNTKTGLNYLWVNAADAVGGVVRYGDGSHDEADVEEVSVIVPFDAAKTTYNFINIHWAYSGWTGEWAIDGLEVAAEELCEDFVPTAIDNTNVVEKAQKFIENGQLFIIKNGVKYNAQGAVIK